TSELQTGTPELFVGGQGGTSQACHGAGLPVGQQVTGGHGDAATNQRIYQPHSNNEGAACGQELEGQDHKDRVEQGREQEVQLNQAVAQEVGQQHGNQIQLAVVRQLQEQEGRPAAQYRAKKTPAIALAGDGKARFHDHQNCQDDPVTVSCQGTDQAQFALEVSTKCTNSQGHDGGDADACCIAEVRGLQLEITGQHAQAQLFARQHAAE